MPALAADETFDQLRGRFMRYRQGRPLFLIHTNLDVHPNTMQRFLNGADPSPIVMRKIQQWCDREQRLKGETTHGDT